MIKIYLIFLFFIFSVLPASGTEDSGFEVSGCLQIEAVWRGIQKDRRKVERCYNQALMSNPRLNGKIIFSWHISCATGKVTSVSKVESDIKSAPILEKCLQDVIKTMQFPQVHKGVYTSVKYPFVFTPKNNNVETAENNQGTLGAVVDPIQAGVNTSKRIDTVQEDRANAQNAPLVLQEGQTGRVGTPFSKTQATGAGGLDHLTSASTTLQASGPRLSNSVGAGVRQGGSLKVGLSGLNSPSVQQQEKLSIPKPSKPKSLDKEMINKVKKIFPDYSYEKGVFVRGMYSKKTVEKVLKESQKDVEYCKSKLKNYASIEQGKLSYWIKINADGYVEKMDRVESTFEKELEFLSCVESVVERLIFPLAMESLSNENTYSEILWPIILVVKN